MKEILKDGLNKKERLLNEICDVYGYELLFKDNQIHCYDDIEDDTSYYIYNNIDEALVDWLDTLIESELEYRNNNDEITWIKEIEFIKNIKDDIMFDSSSNIVQNSLIYGEVPEFLNKRLSVVLNEQISKVDTYIAKCKNANIDLEVYKLNLPVEFIVRNNELSIIKIPNKEFFSRLINGDNSEIEFDEMDVFDKNGLLNIIPLQPVNKIQKFSLNIPIALIKRNSKLRINHEINYLKLF